jgi:hypothetical protein
LQGKGGRSFSKAFLYGATDFQDDAIACISLESGFRPILGERDAAKLEHQATQFSDSMISGL